MWESRVSPLSGVLFALLLIASSLIINNYAFMPPQEEVAAFYAGSPLRIMTGAYVGLLAAFFLIWFSGAVSKSLREGASGRLATIAAGGGVLAAGMVALGYLAMYGAAERAWTRGFIDPGGAAVLADLASFTVGTGAAIGLAALIGAFAVGAFRSPSVPSWLAWVSALIAIGLVSPVNYMVLAVALVWILVMAVRLYRAAPELVVEGAGR